MFCYPSGPWNFVVAPRFVENLCNPVHDYDCVTFRIREPTKMINAEKKRTKKRTNKIHKRITATVIAVFISATIHSIYYVELI